MKIAILFEHFGPYHVARLRAAVNACRHEEATDKVIPIELFGKCETYTWNEIGQHQDIDARIVFPDHDSTRVSPSEIRDSIRRLLNDIQPDVVFVHGWSLPGAVATIRWANQNRTAVVVMSESRAMDTTRRAVKEFIKRQILGHTSAGFVGAPSHEEYLKQLGVPADGIFAGYNAVDNDYFQSKSAQVRADEKGIRQRLFPPGFPQQYFFSSNRFVEKKNLQRLIEAYGHYRENATNPWGLVMAGDGPLRTELVEQVESLSLQDSIHFPGFIQYDQLPSYYGLASAFVHVSTVEQWGLVVNEAAASKLPLVVSQTTGSAECLVKQDQNGFLCDAFDTHSITEALGNIASLSWERLDKMGMRSAQIVSDFGPQQFATGVLKAANFAVKNPRRPNWISRAIVSLIS